MIGWGLGFYVGFRSMFMLIVEGAGLLGSSGSTLVPLAVAGWFFTHGLIVALAQSVLVYRWTDRRTTILWAGWTLVACGVASLAEIFGSESMVGEGVDPWIRVPLQETAYGILFGLVSVPAVKQLLAAKATSR